MEIAYNNKIVFDFNNNWYMNDCKNFNLIYLEFMCSVHHRSFLKLFQNRKYNRLKSRVCSNVRHDKYHSKITCLCVIYGFLHAAKISQRANSFPVPPVVVCT